MVGISTSQVAELLNNAFDKHNITAEKVLHLVETGLFKNISENRSIRVELKEVESFTKSIRVVNPIDWPISSLFRVSLIGIREDEIKRQDGSILRSHAGADYSGMSGLSPKMLELSWTGIWEVSDTTIEETVKSETILFGTTKGYIDPRYIRKITGAHRDWETGRVWWEVEPASELVMKFIGSGLWMDVDPGRQSGLLSI